jgi:hypothetical protein
VRDRQLFANNAYALLDVDFSAFDAGLMLRPGPGVDRFPTPADDEFFLITIEDNDTLENEIVRIGSRNDGYLTVLERGCEGTFVRDWPAGSLVDCRLTADSIRSIEERTHSPITISGAQSDVVDVVFKRSTKWMITITCDEMNRATAFEVLAVMRADDSVSYNIVSRVGDKIDVNVNVTSMDGALALACFNNSAFPVSVSVSRMS